MKTLAELRAELRTLNVNIVSTLDDKTMSAAERGQRARRMTDEVKGLEKQIADEEHLAAERSKYSGLGETGAGDGTGRHRPGKTFGITRPLGQAPPVAFDDAQMRALYEALVDGKSITIESKAATTSADVPMSTVPDYRLPPVAFRREPTRVASLLPASPTDRSEVDYFKITTAATAAAAVAEGAAKPESNVVYAKVVAPIRKIAHVTELTDETLADFPAFLAVIQEELLAGLILAENNELLNGSGVAPHLTGLLTTSGILTQAKGADTGHDAIFKATTALRVGTSFAEADGMVVHPNDWQELRLLKDSNEQYYGGGPFTGAYGNGPMPGPMLWGLNVAITTQIPEGTALVGSFAQAAEIFVRWGARIETANQGEAQFKNNATLIRCEERIGLAVYRPACLCKVTGL